MSSADENKALVRRFLEAMGEGNLELMKEIMATDFIDRSLLPGQESDREGYLRGVAEEQAAFSRTSLTIEDQIAEGDKVVTRIRTRGNHDRGEFMGLAPTGQEAEVTITFVHRIAGGKIAEEWSEGTGELELLERRVEQERLERVRPKSGRLSYANAGHNLPCCRHEHAVSGLSARGMPLGLMPQMSYEENVTDLAPAECVLFYTDGLVEAHNPQGEMFGTPRLRSLLSKRPEGGRGLSATLMEELERFTGEGWEQEDDITLITLKRSATRS